MYNNIMSMQKEKQYFSLSDYFSQLKQLKADNNE